MEESPARAPVVGVVGLGRMGTGVLSRLGEHYDLVAHDVADRAEIAAECRAGWCPRLSSLAAAVDVLVTVLPGPIETDAVLREILPALRPGVLWIDLGSGHPAVTADLAAVAAARGCDVVAAPMGGGVADAKAGTLTFFVGGDPAAVARARPILELLSREDGIRLCGPGPADGQVVKLLSNALWFANSIAAAEALLVGQAHGLAPKRLLELLADSAGSSVALARHIPAVLSGDYLGSFGIDRVVEELDAVRDLAASRRLPIAVLDASRQVHAQALARYGPELGELLGVRLLEERSGQELR